MRVLFLLIACAGAVTLVAVEARAGDLVFDPAGNLYVADASKHSVFKYAPDGTKSSFATGLKYPLGLCFDKNGSLFVSDGEMIAPSSQRSIVKFTPVGKKSTFVRGVSSVGMAVDHSGNVFVAEGDSVFKFSPEGVKSTVVTLKVANFIGLAFDGSGNLFVADQAIADTGAGRSILKFSPDGARAVFADGLKDPDGLTADDAGNVYVLQETADAGSRAILKFNPAGAQSTFATGLKRPSGLCPDGKGNLFVWNGHSIVKFNSTGTQSTFASDWISPDKQWEYKCDEYGLGQCAPEIVKTGTTQVALDLDEELQVHDPEARQAEVIWAPDSKRFAFNYSPPHAAHTTYETVAFYQLNGDKWVQLPSSVEETEQTQLVELAKKHLLKGFNPKACAPERDILKLRSWSDVNTAILYAPCYGRTSGELEAGFLFTLKFDANGNWKIVSTRRMSKKELEAEEQ